MKYVKIKSVLQICISNTIENMNCPKTAVAYGKLTQN